MHFHEWKCMNFDKISIKFVRNGPIKNIPSLVQIMAWHPPGAKPLSEPMMDRLPMLICDAQPHPVKMMTSRVSNWQKHINLEISDTIPLDDNASLVHQVMASCQIGYKPLFKPMMTLFSNMCPLIQLCESTAPIPRWLQHNWVNVP